jgi:two-component system OmpR family response regulator
VTPGGGSRVLIVEDDLRLGRTLVRGLREAGFSVEVAPSGEAALDALVDRPVDVVMLDVVLPGIDGFETCRRLRETDASTPVVMLSARGRVADRVAGLEAGADDYLGKPFSFVELVARLRALVRRGKRRRTEAIEVGPLRIDPAARTASRDALLEQVWDVAYEQRSNVVDAYVRLLRVKLDRPFASEMLHTVRGAGYRLQPPT